MAAQQAPPAQTGAQSFGAKKIFVAERGVLPHSYTVGVELRTRQNSRVESFDLHLPAERPFQMNYQICMHAVGPDETRDPTLQGDDAQHDRQRGLPPPLQLVHLARKFRRVMRKRVGAAARTE